MNYLVTNTQAPSLGSPHRLGLKFKVLLDLDLVHFSIYLLFSRFNLLLKIDKNITNNFSHSTSMSMLRENFYRRSLSLYNWWSSSLVTDEWRNICKKKSDTNFFWSRHGWVWNWLLLFTFEGTQRHNLRCHKM